MEYLDSIQQLNPLAIAASTAAMLLVGAVWTSPFLFGKSWVRLSGIRPGDVRPSHVRVNAVVGFITAAITAVLLALVAAHAGESAPMLFFGVGFIWLFIMLTQVNAFVRRREPFALFLIATTRSLVMLMAGAAVFYFWR